MNSWVDYISHISVQDKRQLTSVILLNSLFVIASGKKWSDELQWFEVIIIMSDKEEQDIQITGTSLLPTRVILFS